MIGGEIREGFPEQVTLKLCPEERIGVSQVNKVEKSPSAAGATCMKTLREEGLRT